MTAAYITTMAVITGGTLAAVFPTRRTPYLGVVSWMLGSLLNELPFALGYVLAVSTGLALGAGALDSPAGVVLIGTCALVLLGLVELVLRASATSRAVETALAHDLGTRPAPVTGEAPLRRLARIMLLPLPLRPLEVERTREVIGGPAHEFRVDLLHRRGRQGGGPVLVHVRGRQLPFGGGDREPDPCCTASPARGGCASASRTTRAAPAGPCSRSCARRWSSTGHGGTPGTTAPIPPRSSSAAAPPVHDSHRWPP